MAGGQQEAQAVASVAMKIFEALAMKTLQPPSAEAVANLYALIRDYLPQLLHAKAVRSKLIEEQFNRIELFVSTAESLEASACSSST